MIYNAQGKAFVSELRGQLLDKPVEFALISPLNKSIHDEKSNYQKVFYTSLQRMNNLRVTFNQKVTGERVDVNMRMDCVRGS